MVIVICCDKHAAQYPSSYWTAPTRYLSLGSMGWSRIGGRWALTARVMMIPL